MILLVTDEIYSFTLTACSLCREQEKGRFVGQVLGAVGVLTAYVTLTSIVQTEYHNAIASLSRRIVFTLCLSDEGGCDGGFFVRPIDRGRI